MKLRNMFLCDAASSNPDNTFSVLRGGINTITLPAQQPPAEGGQVAAKPIIKISLVATIELEITEMGRLHNLELALLDADGKRVLPDLRANFQQPVSQKKGTHNIVLNMFINFNNAGTYGFYINVDGNELGYHPLYVDILDVKKG